MAQKQILIVDDDEFGRTLISGRLRKAGYDIFEARDGDACTAYLRSAAKPDLIITDVVMPNKDGLEVVMEIKRDYPDVKVITISGGGSGWGGDYLAMSKKLGSDAIFPKPVDLNALEKTVAELVGG
jgi:CheY-like chemotaxis protein